MLRKMPGFSKDIMRTIFCTLVFLFSLPWSLNSNLTTSHKNTEVTNTAENSSGRINYTNDSGTDNVVSLSRAQTQYLTTPYGDDEKSNQNKGRKMHDSEYNLTMAPAQAERQIIQEEATTPQKEIRKPTEGTHRPHASFLLERENTTELNVLTKTTNATVADVLPEEKTSRGPIETLEATRETPSDFTGHYGGQENKTVMEGNNTNNRNGDLHTIQPTIETTDQPNPATHAHTSAIITAKDFNKTVSTNFVKTTEREVVSDRWTSTQGPELKTSSMIKPTKTLMTTKKKPAKKINPPSEDNQKANPGPAVAAVVGTTFVLMFIAIIVILVRKRKMQKKRLENPEWAGPSPFLDGDVQPNLPSTDESETIKRQGFNQVSISRYLPQRLSKHLAFERNTSEEVLMEDILQGTTFGRQNPDEVQTPNKNPTVAQDSTEEEKNEIRDGPASVDSLDTKTSASESAKEPVMESEVSKQTDDLTPNLSFSTDNKMKPPPLVSIDLDSLSEEAAPLQTSDGGIIPPAPPLP
ncbi:protein EVI2B [Pseudorasbora parva]|uniref:protein EVI2B n=1 Tax=Pseudorasbora parva TaxID=51549 RepID=UPI00351DE31E